MEFLSSYGLFVAKIVTVVIAIILISMVIFSFALRKQNKKGDLKLIDLSEAYRERQREMQQVKMSDAEYKVWLKTYKKQRKIEEKKQKADAKVGQTTLKKPCLFVIDFKGSMNALEVNALREEITAILSIADNKDEVLLRLESPGGVVHGYGLAASQLNRLREKGLKLIVSVDKVAASGGYMMACVADHIVAAPFAIIGSIGVVAQVPNFHRLLKKKDIDVELHTAGEYKRTLTLLGENTEQGRKKFVQDLNEAHQLFKDFVHQKRPALDINAVATGEHWYGVQAKEKGLIDEIGVSDDIIINQIEAREIIAVTYTPAKRFVDRLMGSMIENADKLLIRWWQRGQKPLF
ncbi:protease SohB [Arsenophonus nasoniae]|uniref:Probable protease n=1 Tax=Arsenophonus nasoniae TaxID=638 RepID=D2TZE0_9GAMM|nr:protease SohB [Arsenophonus nasoniae]QBY43407.1 putative protease SohB [Arsenophonus nasoniae]WGM07398.1 protease SohB [Arsenophonus nasoniae]WGM12270.1 protease SohB [Arsenophonus nasoniae]WGM16948.1 protease SohB [Arsenophonus nasoniae]CBA72986.1 probable protease [Arsenophonus nasoniae]